MAHLKRSTVEVGAEENCLAHALIIAICRLNNDSNYKAYRQGREISPVVGQLLTTTDIDLKKGVGSQNKPDFRSIFTNIKSLCIQD